MSEISYNCNDLAHNFPCISANVCVYVNQGAGAGIWFGPAGLSRKEHHVSHGPSHRGGREPARNKRDYVFTAEQYPRNDVKRAVQALHGAGLKVGRVELHGGKVLIIPAGDEEVADDSTNSFDKIMRKPGA
jgi:hypothetical protein